MYKLEPKILNINLTVDEFEMSRPGYKDFIDHYCERELGIALVAPMECDELCMAIRKYKDSKDQFGLTATHAIEYINVEPIRDELIRMVKDRKKFLIDANRVDEFMAWTIFLQFLEGKTHQDTTKINAQTI